MTFRERRQRVSDPSGVLLFLEITAPSFSGPLRAVNDTQNWTSQGVEYIGVPFGFKLPDDVAGQPARAVLEIGNVGTGMTDELERLLPNETVLARIMVSDRADPNVIERTFYLPMTNVSVTPTAVTAQCGVDFLTRQQSVRLRFTPFLTPGAFA